MAEAGPPQQGGKGSGAMEAGSAPWLSYTVAQAQELRRSVAHSTDTVLESTRSHLSDMHSASSHYSQSAKSIYNTVRAEYGHYEDMFFGKIKDCSFRFVTNDLDAAVRNAKKTTKTNRKKERRRESKKKNKERDPKVSFIVRTCRFLKEPKGHLIDVAVERLGIEVVGDLVHEVKTIERNGGQMTADGRRRRTPGGVLWNVLKSRYEEAYKSIMAAGKDFEKQQKRNVEVDGRQQKRKVEVDAMVIDEQPSTKRRRTGATRSFTGPAAQVKRTGVTIWPSRCQGIDDIQSKVDLDNSRSLTQAQSAWAAGVKQGEHKSGPDDMEMYDNAVKKKPASMAERLRVPIKYDDLLETR